MKRFVVPGIIAACALSALLSGCGAAESAPNTSVSNDNGDLYVQHVPVDGKTVTCLEWSGDGLSCDWTHAR